MPVRIGAGGKWQVIEPTTALEDDADVADQGRCRSGDRPLLRSRVEASSDARAGGRRSNLILSGQGCWASGPRDAAEAVIPPFHVRITIRPMTLSRRQFLWTTAASSVCLPALLKAQAAPSNASSVFRHGVASGATLSTTA